MLAVPLVVPCLGIAVFSAVASWFARPRLAKSKAAAASFAVPGVGFILLAAAAAIAKQYAVGVALLAVALVCLSAGAIFVPTRGTRFRDFERAFWAYVRDRDRV